MQYNKACGVSSLGFEKISGRFDVTLNPVSGYVQGLHGNQLHRTTLDKTFFGELQATSQGEMLSVITAVKGSAGYVAIEQVSGKLCGHEGTFVLQHSGTMNRGDDSLNLHVVPDSGTGQLAGLQGTMAIRTEQGEHFYDFHFSLDGPVQQA
ncbi:DUF3224 domain-containing protein [Salinimonas lutimaris]|uniref:DUF3224 domain-containing protein n=1 Tax=Salinimonas lutimaris TaxID=914153 RepID=UPI0010BFFC63|nr:DUF3224 domain-containing protein [Salinimonas lutimaris]